MTERTAATATWGWVLQVAGAVTGLAVIVYVVGAVTMWVRLWHGGFRPTRGIEHLSRPYLIALGLRGVLWVTLFAAAIVVLALCVRKGYRMLRSRWSSGAEPGLPPTETERRRAQRRRNVAFGATLVVVVVASAFVGWRWFGAVLAAAVALAIAYWYPTVKHAAKPYVALAVLSVTAIVAAVCFEVGDTAKIDAVVLTPVPKELIVRSPSPELLDEVAFPYFGESSKFVYVGQIRSVLRSLERTGGYDFNVCGEHNDIVEVERDGLLLRFTADQDFLYRDLEAPGLLLWHRIFGGPERSARGGRSPSPDFNQTAYERRRQYLCRRLYLMNHPIG
jgi:hypothetical protein